MATQGFSAADIELAREVGEYYSDPLGFVLDCFKWGQGSLSGEFGPDVNQREFLNSLGQEVRSRNFDGHTPVMPILMAMASGHGTGKSAMGAWLAWWILSTRPGSIGTVTAGSYTQLESRTWAAIQWWGKHCITYHWFQSQADRIYALADREGWKLVAQTSKPENAQSFAGQHARTSTSWYLFDEASEIDDAIWKTAYGGLTDGEPMFFAWGQLVRNTGAFYNVCCGSEKERWNTRRVDSRTSRFTNQELIKQWASDYGEESDYFRVRVLGYPPSADELQYIDRKRVDEARKRIQIPFEDEPLIAGFDVSGGGKAWNVIRFRRGLSMRVKEPIRIPGEKDPDRSMRVGICAELLADRRPGHQIAAMFVDAAFGAPIVERLRHLGFTNVFEVNFGSESPDEKHFANLRAYMYGKLKEWLLLGSIPDDDNLCQQMCLPGFHFRTGTSKLVIESKADLQKRGEKSPDDADAAALTFARAVPRVDSSIYSRYAQDSGSRARFGGDSWMT